MNDIKMPKINFVPLKQGITDDELNEYMVNSYDTNFLIYLRCKYKTDKEVTKATSKELIQCAKMVNKLDNKMMVLNGQ